MLSLSLCCAVTAAVALVMTIRAFLRRSVKFIPGPPSPSLLFGHELQLTRQPDVGYLEFQWMHDYGATWRTKGIFGVDVLMTADPKALQYIYHKSGYNYIKKTSQVHTFRVMGGPNIGVVDTQDHPRHRKVMNPAFSAAHLRTFLPLFQRIGHKLSDNWKADLANGGVFDVVMNKWLSRVTLDIIGEAAFDYDYGALETGSASPLCKAYDNIFKDTHYKISRMDMLFRATWDYLPNAVLNMFQYIPAEPFTRMRNIRNLYTEYGKQILREQRTEIQTEKQPSSKDVMSLLIQANMSADVKTRLSEAELLAEMFALTLAGHETTSSTLTFLTYELARHPEYQARLRQEIKTVRTKVAERGGFDFTMEDLDSMPLMLNAIKETLRFHPIVPALPRVASKDDVLPLSHPIVTTTGETIWEIPISSGQVIVTSFAGYQRLADVWGEDADTWNPDRFFRIDIGKQTNVGAFANLMSFSAGVRACIGWRFSIIEMQALLADLVENFQFALPLDKVDIQRAPLGVVMSPMIRGKEDMGTAMPLRVSLAQ